MSGRARGRTEQGHRSPEAHAWYPLPPFQPRAPDEKGLVATPRPNMGCPGAISVGGVGRCVGPHTPGAGGQSRPGRGGGWTCSGLCRWPCGSQGAGTAVGTQLILPAQSRLGMAFALWIMRAEGA